MESLKDVYGSRGTVVTDAAFAAKAWGNAVNDAASGSANSAEWNLT